jgi:hypothetical protein
MGSPLAVSYITADQPAILERSNALPELSRIGTGAEPSRPQSEGPVASFRVFGFTARDAGVTGGESSSCEVGVSSRVCRPPKYRPYWLGDPALPLAVASAMRFSLAGPR